MKYDCAIIGAGLSGITLLNSLVENLKKNKKSKKINICVIDKDKDLIAGGVAYSIKLSTSGFFNNPLRLSHPEFIRWIKKKKNLKSIKNYLLVHGSCVEKNWAKKNFNYNNFDFSEEYFPRVVVNFWLKDLLKRTLIKAKPNISVTFFESEVFSIIKKNNIWILNGNKKFKKLNEKNLKFDYANKSNLIESKFITLSLGIPAPIKFHKKKNINSNYLHDFYSEGSTEKLKKLISGKKKKKIKIFFIGYKAGLLEPLMEMQYLLKNLKKKIEIISLSSSLKSLEPAIKSKNFNIINLTNFKINQINKIKTAKIFFDKFIGELKTGKKNGLSKYDIWTEILKNKIIDRVIKNFNTIELKNYNNIYFPKIRSLTRFTFPEAVMIKNDLIKRKILKVLKGKVINIKKNNDLLTVIIKNKKLNSMNVDIVINASGPQSMLGLIKDNRLIKSLNSKCNILEKGFEINDKFEISKNIFSPGYLSHGFNPARKTLFKAIIENSFKVGKYISNGI